MEEEKYEGERDEQEMTLERKSRNPTPTTGPIEYRHEPVTSLPAILVARSSPSWVLRLAVLLRLEFPDGS